MRLRNAYSTPRGDVLYGAVFTLAQLRSQYSETGGPLTPRRRRALRRLIPPYVSDDSGLQRKFCLLIPKSWALDKMPDAMRDALRPHFSRVTRAWVASECPWLGDPDRRIADAAIDNELGTELGGDEDPDEWDEATP